MSPRAVFSPLSWVPVEGPGDRFCSPACGMGCTRFDRDRAEVSASALAQQLGPGWAPRVWENLGWHFEATAADGQFAVVVRISGGRPVFSATLSRAGGAGQWFASSPESPRAAVRAVALALHAEIGSLSVLERLVEGL